MLFFVLGKQVEMAFKRQARIHFRARDTWPRHISRLVADHIGIHRYFIAAINVRERVVDMR